MNRSELVFSAPKWARVAAVVAAMLMVSAPAAQTAAAATPITITVDSSADADPSSSDGFCTLREAILASNTNTAQDTCPAGTSALDTIAFSGVTQIDTALGVSLPPITAPVILDGSSGGAPTVILNGPGNAMNDIGLEFAPGSKGSTLKGFKITHYHIGVYLGGGGATLFNNWIGTSDGATAATNTSGVQIQSPTNRIGLPGAEPNLISGNSIGIMVNTNAPGTTIQNNWIGVNSGGNAGLSAGGSIGIVVYGSKTLIGGMKPGQGNVISGSGQGIYLVAPASKTKIQRNFMGTNAAGTAGVPNAVGIIDAGSKGTLIGGPMPAASNLMASSITAAIQFIDQGTSNKSFTTVTGNLIGFGSNGLPLPNANGIRFDLPAKPVKAKISGNLIAGSAGAAINVNGAFAPQLVGSTNNCIIGNAAGFTDIAPTAKITFKNNYWGSPTGPGGAYPGSGDTVSTNLVRVKPFRTTMPASCLGWAPHSVNLKDNSFFNKKTTMTKLSWSKVPTASGFDAPIGTFPGPTGLIAAGGPGNSFSVGPLDYGAYYWKVYTVTTDNFYWSGPQYTFYVTIQTSPKPGSTTKTGNVKFTWVAYPGAASYDLSIFSGAGCTAPLTSAGGIHALKITFTGLAPGSYSWHLKPDNAALPMPCWSFIVP